MKTLSAATAALLITIGAATAAPAQILVPASPAAPVTTAAAKVQALDTALAAINSFAKEIPHHGLPLVGKLVVGAGKSEEDGETGLETGETYLIDVLLFRSGTAVCLDIATIDGRYSARYVGALSSTAEGDELYLVTKKERVKAISFPVELEKTITIDSIDSSGVIRAHMGSSCIRLSPSVDMFIH